LIEHSNDHKGVAVEEAVVEEAVVEEAVEDQEAHQ
jgi:hypothetical protein